MFNHTHSSFLPSDHTNRGENRNIHTLWQDTGLQTSIITLLVSALWGNYIYEFTTPFQSVVQANKPSVWMMLAIVALWNQKSSCVTTGSNRWVCLNYLLRAAGVILTYSSVHCGANRILGEKLFQSNSHNVKNDAVSLCSLRHGRSAQGWYVFPSSSLKTAHTAKLSGIKASLVILQAAK